jgi:hypothetical protein
MPPVVLGLRVPLRLRVAVFDLRFRPVGHPDRLRWRSKFLGHFPSVLPDPLAREMSAPVSLEFFLCGNWLVG